MRVEVVDGPDGAAAAAADAIARFVTSAVDERGTASLALSGGKSPERMFEELGKLALEWNRIHLFQVDERLARDGDPERNLTVIRERLLANVTIPATNLHPMPVGTPNLDAAADRYAGVLESVCGAPPVLDVVHLGLGSDGHTASLFEGDPVLDADATDVEPTAEHHGRRRLTLTVPVLNRARERVWLVVGADKADALRRVVEGDDVPAARIRGDHSVAFADHAAALALQR